MTHVQLREDQLDFPHVFEVPDAFVEAAERIPTLAEADQFVMAVVENPWFGPIAGGFDKFEVYYGVLEVNLGGLSSKCASTFGGKGWVVLRTASLSRGSE